MVGFEEDFFTTMVQDSCGSGAGKKKSKSKSNSNSGFDDDFGYGDFGDTGFGNSEEAAQAPQTRSRRRASIGSPAVPVSSSRTQTNSRSDRPSESGTGTSSSSSSRRPRGTASSSSSSSRSLDGQLEAVPGVRTKSSSTEQRSVVSSASHERARRAGRRASMASGVPPTRSTSHRTKEEPAASVDYGYGDGDNGNGNAVEEDFGYGDQDAPAVEQQPAVRSQRQRQRRCSIADVVSSTAPSSSNGMDYGYGDAIPDNDAVASGRGGQTRDTSQRKLGAATSGGGTGGGKNTMSNMAIPMAAIEEPKKGTNRRGSIAMLGMGFNSKKEEKAAPEVAAKKPGADRDRHRQGTLLDRVGASSGDRGSGRSGTASYSDRVMSK
jgi:hypothetical protein